MLSSTIPQKGILISLEGFECSGKSTALQHISSTLTKRGVDHITCREPGGTRTGERVREMLLDSANEMDPATEAMLFYTSRVELNAKVIRPSLSQGKVVLVDRYYDSTRAYQGALGSVNIENLHRLMCRTGMIEHPSATLLFDVDYATFYTRRVNRGVVSGEEVNTFEDMRSAEYQRQVISKFRHLALSEPTRFKVIDATLDRNEVGLRAVSAVMEAIAYANRSSG